MTERDGLERRRLLGALGVGMAAGIGGCLGDSGSKGDENDENDNSGAQVYEPTMEIEFEDGGPFSFDDGERCAVCGMPAKEHSGTGQLVHENGLAAVFDSPGCLFAYTVSSTPDSPIAAAWTTDYGTRDLIDATAAHFVLITDEDAADDLMGIDPRPYAEREDAVSFLEEWEAEDLTPEEDIIVGLEDVDLEIAEIYRGRKLPDE
ncbi:nitrous oxide reductase accessory protein NosL [Natrinema zhouii]|uniref:Nitrous oxide reductase accessory protein NosL n=1 Tax=Natrinema zhouii TaxID=1710539 RepID=A0A7D6CQL5_9EURY|nr:nitrous oxide reductase accessory protein NosL [Natrinema zhouii]QLK25650.1 nitrous oxide reductase accessory protein NosL [Natrinema zhouii]